MSEEFTKKDLWNGSKEYVQVRKSYNIAIGMLSIAQSIKYLANSIKENGVPQTEEDNV